MTTVGAGDASAAASGLSTAELTAWRTFLRAHATVVRRLEAELLL